MTTNENKTALLNAGFEDGVLMTGKFRIQVDTWEDDVFEVTISTIGGFNIGYPEPVQGLKELNKVCFGFVTRDLDFTEKPKYDWETVFKGLTVFEHNLYLDAETAIHSLCKSRVLMDGVECGSVLAQIKLNLIIQQIDKDYQTKYEKCTGAIILSGGKLIAVYFEANNRSDYLIKTASLEGAKMLLESNPKLLQELFKIQQDAND